MTDQVMALQLCPFSDYLTAGLETRVSPVRWFALDNTAQQEFLARRAGDVRAVVTGGHVGCPSPLMTALPNLGLIAINGVGFDKVDLSLARARGVRVTSTPDVLTDDVADLAVGLVIAALRRLPAADFHVRDGQWPSGDMPLARTVTGRKFGIVGLGRIGSAIAARLHAFGPIAYTDLAPKPVAYRFLPGVIDLAHDSDVLVIASAANAGTRHLIDVRVLEALGPDGLLVNIARGSLVDEQALVVALDAGTIAGAALDVFEDEPNVPAALRCSKNVILTPHIASATVETRTRMADLVLRNLDAFLAGTPLLTALV